MAILEYTIPPNDSTFKVEVIDRQGENCDQAVLVAQRMGQVTNDERTGPNCDEVHEGMVDGGGLVGEGGGGGDSIV